MVIIVDNPLLLWITSMISYVSMIHILNKDIFASWVYFFPPPIIHFLIALYMRLRLKWTKVSRFEVFLLKSSLAVSALTYVVIGAVYMIDSYVPSRGMRPDIDANYKNFVLLFVFANFSFFFELYALVGHKDQTDLLNSTYEVVF
jgi:hypothetical protein